MCFPSVRNRTAPQGLRPIVVGCWSSWRHRTALRAATSLFPILNRWRSMSEKKHRATAKPPDRKVGQPWRVPVVQTDVPESGLHLDLAADERVRGEIARLADLPALPRLEASLDVTRHGR